MIFINDEFKEVHYSMSKFTNALANDNLVYKACETSKEIERMIEFGKIITQADAAVLISDSEGERVYFLKDGNLVVTDLFVNNIDVEAEILVSFLNFIENEFTDKKKPVFRVGECLATGRFYMNGEWVSETVPIYCDGDTDANILRSINYLMAKTQEE